MKKMRLKTKISIILFIIILVVGLYIGSQVNRVANKFKMNWKEMLTGKIVYFYAVNFECCKKQLGVESY